MNQPPKWHTAIGGTNATVLLINAINANKLASAKYFRIITVLAT